MCDGQQCAESVNDGSASPFRPLQPAVSGICRTLVDSDASRPHSSTRPRPPPTHGGTYLGRPLLWPASELHMAGCRLQAQVDRSALPGIRSIPLSCAPDQKRPVVENARKGCRAAGFTAPFRLTVANASARRAPGLVCDHLNEMRPRRDGHSFQTQAGLSSDAGVGNVARIGSIGFAQEQVGRTMGPTRSAYDAGISNGSGVEHHFGPVLLAKGPFILPPP